MPDYDPVVLSTMSPLVFEGIIEAVEPTSWMGTHGDHDANLVLIRVTENLVGEISSGRVYYFDAFMNLYPGVGHTVMVFGGPKISPLFTYMPATTMPAYAGIPPYEDIVVPWNPDTVSFHDNVGSEPESMCFVGDRFLSSYDSMKLFGFDEQRCPDGHWEALKAFVRAHAKPGQGMVMPGIQP